MASLLAASGLIVILVLSVVDATTVVMTTCKAAANSDKRVNYDFCVLELTMNNDNPNADAWGLAKVAATVGVTIAEKAIADIKALLTKQETDAKTRKVLLQCQNLYHEAEITFSGAHDSINNRDYAKAKAEVSLATTFAQKCDDAFAKAAVPSPLTQRSLYTMQIAIVCTAITNLIK
ncbi:hypothetical protein ACP4OV_005828 [Aristida adscensionis]